MSKGEVWLERNFGAARGREFQQRLTHRTRNVPLSFREFSDAARHPSTQHRMRICVQSNSERTHNRKRFAADRSSSSAACRKAHCLSGEYRVMMRVVMTGVPQQKRIVHITNIGEIRLDCLLHRSFIRLTNFCFIALRLWFEASLMKGF